MSSSAFERNSSQLSWVCRQSPLVKDHPQSQNFPIKPFRRFQIGHHQQRVFQLHALPLAHFFLPLRPGSAAHLFTKDSIPCLGLKRKRNKKARSKASFPAWSKPRKTGRSRRRKIGRPDHFERQGHQKMILRRPVCGSNRV